MNYRIVCSILGRVMLIEGALLLIPAFVALGYGESCLPFLITAVIAAAIGGALRLIKPKTNDLYPREGFVSVALSWIGMSVVGAIPFVLSGDIPNYVDALFETVSGFTTTGSTILTDIEAMSRGCMFWRMFTHWIGGMGVLVFLMAIVPMSGEHSMHIMRAESTGPSVGKLVPRVRKTSAILYGMYFGFTVLEFILLLCGGLNWYEALTHAFATAGTGGFSTRAASIGGFGSRYVEYVIAIFMLLFSVNFNVYFLLLMGKVRTALRGEEFQRFWEIVAVSCAAIMLIIYKSCADAEEAFRLSFFQVASIISTTGFSTVDFLNWPITAQTIIVLLMFCGACAGSTGGGMKLSRIMILLRSARAECKKLLRPHRVAQVHLDGKVVGDSPLKSTQTFLILYMFLLLAGSLVVSVDGLPFESNFTAALSSLSNIGPGLGPLGPSGSFAVYSGFSKLVLSLLMLTGRLEIYPILMCFTLNPFRKR